MSITLIPQAMEIVRPGGVSALSSDVIDQLMPMHLIVRETGHIMHAGPSLVKLRPDQPLVGRRFLEVFELKRPAGVNRITDLMRRGSGRVKAVFRDAPRTGFVGLVAPLEGGDGIFINLSFGFNLIEAVQDYELTGADFAATDLAVEMLYLVEAKTVALNESKALNQRLQGAKLAAEEQAYTDTLTGLSNRRGMDEVLQRLIASGRRFGMMNLDLDFFKAVNDRLGHAAGDYVLCKVAAILREELREGDAIVRAGGDEFVLIFAGLSDPKRLSALGARIIKRLEEPMIYEGQTCQISGSIGLTVTDFYKAADVETMMQDADVALYASKRNGRGQVTIFSESLASISPS